MTDVLSVASGVAAVNNRWIGDVWEPAAARRRSGDIEDPPPGYQQCAATEGRAVRGEFDDCRGRRMSRRARRRVDLCPCCAPSLRTAGKYLPRARRQGWPDNWRRCAALRYIGAVGERPSRRLSPTSSRPRLKEGLGGLCEVRRQRRVRSCHHPQSLQG